MERCLPIACALLVGCRSAGPPAVMVSLPSAAEISRIELTPSTGEERPTTVIEDPGRIARFTAFINERRDGWVQPPYTFPSGEYTVSVTTDDGLAAVFWLSPGRIGGRMGDQGGESNRLRSLEAEEWQSLYDILEIEDPPPPEDDVAP